MFDTKNEFLNRFLKENIEDKKRNLILLVKFGSHLYGTNSESSDLDYNGVYVPSFDEIVTNNFPEQIYFSSRDNETKNSSDDIDIEIFSIYKFFKLAKQNQTVTIDLLNANDESMVIVNSNWYKIKRNAHLFYTKDLTAFFGYARKQAAKYGIKGSRLNVIKELLQIFDENLEKYGNIKLNEPKENSVFNQIIEKFENSEFFRFRSDLDHDNVKHIEICSKVFLNTNKIEYVKKIFEKYYNEYGKRARLAQENKGIDWKAISHAIRAGFQLKEIYENGEIKFPLKKRVFLKKVKNGKLDFSTKVKPILENLLTEVNELNRFSNLPDKIDESKIESLLKEVVIGSTKLY